MAALWLWRAKLNNILLLKILNRLLTTLGLGLVRDGVVGAAGSTVYTNIYNRRFFERIAKVR